MTPTSLVKNKNNSFSLYFKKITKKGFQGGTHKESLHNKQNPTNKANETPKDLQGFNWFTKVLQSENYGKKINYNQ